MTVMQSPPGPETMVDGRRYLYFCGTGYLGLHGHPELIEAACRATRLYGLGSATSRAGFGDTPPTLDVEQQAACFFQTESAFYFPSGYMGNHVLLAEIASRAHTVFLDEYSHFSVAEASQFSRLPVIHFKHTDAESLRLALKENLSPAGVPLVMSDGVFAARGTIAPARDYCDVLSQYPGAMLCLDDCHAVGVLGDRGLGTYSHFGMNKAGVNVDSRCTTLPAEYPSLYAVGTLSKAFGGYGGILWGSKQFVDEVKTASSMFRGASAPPIPAAAASATALRMAREMPEMITRVRENAVHLKRQLQALGLRTDDSPVPIVCLELGSGANMQRIQQALADDGVLIAYNPRYSGLGPEGALRIAVFSTHTREMLQHLVDSIGKYL